MKHKQMLGVSDISEVQDIAARLVAVNKSTSDILVTEMIVEMEIIRQSLKETKMKTMLISKTEII